MNGTRLAVGRGRDQDRPATHVDVHFALAGTMVAPDYAWPLWQALRARLPWLAESGAGIHPLRGVAASGDALYLGRHARLVLRLPRSRADAAAALCGATIELGGEVRVGPAHLRELGREAAQYSPCVLIDAPDEPEFVARCRDSLREMAIDCELVCGRAQEKRVAENSLMRGYSLLLHGLTEDAALRIQERGLGDARTLGCGLFVPHKSVAAVAAR